MFQKNVAANHLVHNANVIHARANDEIWNPYTLNYL
jgi:hypothetical protein